MEKNFYDFVQELKEKNDLVDVIGSYIKLERRGYNYWACCPFHHEKTPSFSINAADRYYHCFGCGVSGDVLGFVKAYENVDFMQAVQILAARAGLEVPAYDDKAAAAAAEKKKKRDRLLLLMRDAARFYLGNLYSGRGGEYLGYLQKRGVSPSTAKKFGLGASFDFDSLPSYLLAQGYTKEECLESGACMQHENGRLYDAEGGRLIVPIINHFDEVIAFGGRALQKTDRAKYKNTRETVLFNKSKTLYNLNLVKKEKQAAGLPYLIMVEGYMDAISLYEAGFKNVVASMGTSLTQTQAKLLKNYCDRIYISYDGDGAGQKATLRGLDILAEAGLNVKVVRLPEGLDPDDVIKKHGREYYGHLLDTAVTLTRFKIDTLARKFDLSLSDEKAKFAVEAAKIIKALENPVEREEYLKQLHEVTGYTMETLYRQTDLSPIPEKAERESAPAQSSATAVAAMDASLKFVLASVLADKPYCDFTADVYPYLPDDFSRRVYDWGMARFKSGEKTGLAAFYDQTPESDAGLLNELAAYPFLEGDGAEKYAECVKAIAVSALSAQKAALAKRFDKTKDADALRALRDVDRKINTIRKGDTEA